MTQVLSNNSLIDSDSNRYYVSRDPNKNDDKITLDQPLRSWGVRITQPCPRIAGSPSILRRSYKQSSHMRNDEENKSFQESSQKVLRSFAFSQTIQRVDKLVKLMDQGKASINKPKSLNVNKFLFRLKESSNSLRIPDLSLREQGLVHHLVDQNLRGDHNVGLTKILDTLPIFEIQSRLIRIIDLTLIFVIVLFCFWYPLQFSFSVQKDLLSWIFDYFQMIINSLDILVRLNRQVIVQGQVIQDRSIIFHNYMRDQLLKDVTVQSCLFCYMLIEFQLFQFLSILLMICLRIPKMIKMIDELNDFYNFGNLLRDVMSLLNMIITVVFCIHVVACIWHGVSVKFEKQGWVYAYGYDQLPTLEIYSISFYWAAMTMTTVGYGDITPKTNYEYICANLTMLFACIIFGYTMNRIGLLLSNIHMRDADFKKNIASLNIYMRQHGVEAQLQSRIRSYLNYVQEAQDPNKNDEIQKMLSKLPEQIQEDLNYQLKGKFIDNCQIFERFSGDFKKNLYKIVEDAQFVPNEIVLDPKQIDDSSLYFIQQGQLQLFHQNQGQNKDLLLGAGQMFGEISFFTDQPRSMKIVSLQFTTCYKISRQRFQELLKDFNKDNELFHYLKECVGINKQFQKLKVLCYCCRQEFHILKNCPKLNLYRDEEKILKTYFYPSYQDRKSNFQRGEREKYDTLSKIKKTMAAVEQIHNNFHMFDSAFSFLVDDVNQSQTFLVRQLSIKQENGADREYNQQTTQTSREQKYELNAKHSQNQEANDQSQLEPIFESQYESDQSFQQGKAGKLIDLGNLFPNSKQRLSISNYQNSSYKRFKTPTSAKSNISRPSLKPSDIQSLQNLQLVKSHNQYSIRQLEQTDLQQYQQSNHEENGQIESVPIIQQQSLKQFFPVFEHNFEKSQEYQNYFPYWNISAVIKRQNSQTLQFRRNQAELHSNVQIHFLLDNKAQNKQIQETLYEYNEYKIT